MADLKTSQETSGYPLQKNDLHRIARSGNNHKVNSEELFSETITRTQLLTLIAGSNLITGRNYKVTNCGASSNLTLILTATAENEVSENATLVYSVSQNFICHYNHISNNVDWLIDNVSNVIYNPFFGTASLMIGKGANNIIYSVGSIFEANLTLLNCVVINTSFTGLSNATLISNSTFKNVNLNSSDSSTITIENCNINNCFLNITSGSSVNFLTIIGDTSASPTYQLNENINGGTIITGEYSSLTKEIDASVVYDGVNTITIPSGNTHIGKYYLKGFNASDNIEYIVNIEQDHTPIIFQNNSSVSIDIIHINSESSIVGYDIFFPAHHGGGGGTPLETNYSYFSGKFNSTTSVFVVIDYMNYHS